VAKVIVAPRWRSSANSILVDPNAAKQERYRSITTGAHFIDGEEVIAKQEFRERRQKLQDIGDLAPEDVARFQMRCFVRAAVSPDGIRWLYEENPLAYVEGNLDTQSVAAYDAPSDRHLLFLRGHVGHRRSVRMMEAKQLPPAAGMVSSAGRAEGPRCCAPRADVPDQAVRVLSLKLVTTITRAPDRRCYPSSVDLHEGESDKPSVCFVTWRSSAAVEHPS
jgi:hypothetical protein